MERCDNITDGYTEEAYIAAVPGLFDALEFKYRPYTYEERERLAATIAKTKDDVRTLAYLRAAVARIVEWSHQDAARQPLAVALANLRTMRPAKANRVVDIVMGYGASDINPKWDDATVDNTLDNLLEAAATGAPVAVVQQAGDEKNSEGG
jgi:hypothetical protein